MGLYNDLNRINLDSFSVSDLAGIERRTSEAGNDLMLGLSAIGSLMFWASDNENYAPEQAKEDMYCLGAMLGTLSEVSRSLGDIASDAMFRKVEAQQQNSGRLKK